MARTLEQVRQELVEWEACLLAVGKNQEYRIGRRQFRRSDLGEIYAVVKDLRREEEALERGGGVGVRYVVPVD